MRAVTYARVSSAAQRERDTIASQLRTLPEFVTRHAWELVRPVATYVDDGRTAKAGRLAARTGLAALLRDAALGLFDVVVVVDLDRLTRSEDLTERGAILGALQRAGVRVASSSTGQVLDLATSSGDLMSSLGGYFAAEWSRKHRERILQGKVTALARGRKPAGPTPYGLAYSRETGVWTIDPERGPIVVEIYRRTAAGETSRAIAEDLEARGVPRPRGRWSSSRVYGIVRSRHPAGEWTADRARRAVIMVPAIVTESQWQAAQDALLRHRRRGLRKTRHVYLLEEIAVCGRCGAPILIRSACGAPRNEAAYVCRGRKIERTCDAPILKVPATDARVWAAIARELEDPALLARLEARAAERASEVHDWTADAAGYRAHLARLERVEQAVLVRFRRGLISEASIDVEIAAGRRERAAVAAQLETAERAAQAAQDERVVAPGAWLGALRGLAAEATPAQRRRVVRALVGRGGAVLVEQRVRLTLVVAAGSRGERAEAAPVLALVSQPGYRSGAGERSGEDVRIRVVA